MILRKEQVHWNSGRFVFILLTTFEHIVLKILQQNQNRYPRLFRLAMDILPIQASSVPCEQVFSSGKETMTPRRSRISPELMEYLQLLKFSFKKGERLNFTEHIGEAAELKELEAQAIGIVPEDMRSYVRSLEPPVV
jgi:hypothetical protein